MNKVFQVLDDLQIDYQLIDHPPVMTCEEADEFHKPEQGGRSKNLFLRNRKGDKHYLVIIESHKQVDLKSLATKLNESKLSFASKERLETHLKLKAGSVSPFGLINDEEHEVIVVLDEDLLKHDKLHYHPNVNTQTVVLSTEDLLRFLESTNNKIIKTLI